MVVVSFHTTVDAFTFEKICKQEGIQGRLTTIPRMISSGCGLAWSAPDTMQSCIVKLVQEKRVCIEDIHLL